MEISETSDEQSSVPEVQEADAPSPLSVEAVVSLLVGHVKPLDHATFSLESWPCLLIAAIAETADRNPRLNTCGWQSRAGTKAAVLTNDITIGTVGDFLLPDRFAARVFALLAAQAIKEASSVRSGARPDGTLWLSSIVEGMHLDPHSPQDYLRVSEAIMWLVGMTVTVSSQVQYLDRRTDTPYPTPNSSAFRLLVSYDAPSDEDYQHSPVRVGWDQQVWSAIISAPAVSAEETNTSSEVRL
jgi:hypothetical protein